MDKSKIGAYIKGKRLEHNLTQNDLAKKINVSYQAVSRWENGDNLPDVEKMSELAGIFCVSIDEIINQGILDKNRFSKKQNSSLKLNFIIHTITAYFVSLFFYMILFSTRTIWLSFLIHIIFLFGISIIYIVPYLKIEAKNVGDYTFLRYSLLTSIFCIVLPIPTFFIEIYFFPLLLIIGIMIAGIAVYISNSILVDFQEKEFNTEITTIRFEKKTNAWLLDIFMSIFGAIILVGTLNYISTTGWFYNYQRYDVILVSTYITIISLLTLLSVIFNLKKSIKDKDFLNIILNFTLLFQIVHLVYMVASNYYKEITLEAFNNMLLHDSYYSYVVIGFILILAIPIIYQIIKRRPFNQIKNTLATYLLVTLLGILYISSYGGSYSADNEVFKLHFEIDNNPFLKIYIAFILMSLLTTLRLVQNSNTD